LASLNCQKTNRRETSSQAFTAIDRCGLHPQSQEKEQTEAYRDELVCAFLVDLPDNKSDKAKHALWSLLEGIKLDLELHPLVAAADDDDERINFIAA